MDYTCSYPDSKGYICHGGRRSLATYIGMVGIEYMGDPSESRYTQLPKWRGIDYYRLL